MSDLHFDADVDIRKIYQKLGLAEARMSSFVGSTVSGGKLIDKSFMGIGNSVGNVSKLMGAAGGLAGLFAFKKLAEEAYEFEKAFGMAMREVQTISTAVQNDFEGISNKIVDLSANGPDDAIQLAKAYYQIVSAGYDGAAGLKLLDVASKSATAGITDTKTSADGLTTVLNAWGIGAENAGKIADVMFKTVERGKTTFGELAANISQVAPLASANNISYQEIFAAIQSLTKQGTSTSEALTQIRSSIIGMNEALGDGWSDTMTYQEGLQAIVDMAGGSQNELKNLLGRVEGVNAALALTGEKALGAAEDLRETEKAVGAMNAAYETMMQEADNKWSQVHNKWTRELRALGKAVKEGSTGLATALNEILTDKQVDIIDPGTKKIVDDVTASISELESKDEKLEAIIKRLGDLKKERIYSLQPTIDDLEGDQPGILTQYMESLNAGLGLGRSFTPGRTKQAELSFYNNQWQIYTNAEKELLKLFNEISATSDPDEDGSGGGSVEEKVRTLSDIIKDIESLQKNIGTGTLEDDIKLMAQWSKLEAEKQEYYNKVRESIKIDVPEKLKTKQATLTTKELGKQDIESKKLLKNAEKITKENNEQYKLEQKKLREQVKQEALQESLISLFQDSSEILGALSYALGEIDSELGETVGNMADIAKNAATTVSSLASGDIVGGIAGGIGIIGNVLAMFDFENNSSELFIEQLNQNISDTNSLLNLMGQYLSSLNGDEWFGFATSNLRSLNSELTKYTEKLKEFDSISYRMDGRRGSLSIDTSNFDTSDWISFLDKVKRGVYSINSDLEELLTTYVDQVVSLESQLQDLNAEIYSTLLGFTKDDITTSISDGILNGLQLSENGLGEFAESFGDLMKKYGSKALESFISEQFLADYYKLFYDLATDGIDTDEKKLLQDEYKRIITESQAFYSGIADIIGDTYDDTGLSGAIQGASEESISMLSGLATAIRLNQLKGLEIANNSLASLNRIADNTSYNKHLERIDETLLELKNNQTNSLGSKAFG